MDLLENFSNTTKFHSNEWIFWVTHIDSRSLSIQSYSTFNICVVNQEQLSIGNHLSIRIAEIKECNHTLITRFQSVRTELIMKDGRKFKIAVADPFYPNFKNRNNASEALAFKEIINTLMLRQQPDYPRSPYKRVKQKAEFYPEDADYDPRVSPLEYYNKYRKRLSVFEKFIRVTVTMVALIILFFIIVLLAQFFNI